MKKTTISLLIASLLPIYCQSVNANLIKVDGSFDTSLSQSDGSEWLNNPSITKTPYDSSKVANNKFIPQYNNGTPITENNVVVVKELQSDFNKFTYIYGGYCDNSKDCVVNNTAVIADGIYNPPYDSSSIIGAGSSYYGAESDVFHSLRGSVFVNNSTSDSSFSGSVVSVGTDSNIISNSVKAEGVGNVFINNSTVSNQISGAYVSAEAYSSNDVTAIAIGNIFYNNSVISSRATPNSSSFNYIIGANAISTNDTTLNPTGSSTALATGNVFINNSTIADNVQIYGAEALATDFANTNNSTAIGRGNVSIYGNTKFENGIGTSIAGAWTSGSLARYYDFFTGNTLSLGNAALAVKTVGNFENYNFYINDYNKSVINTDTALLTIKESIINYNTSTNDNGTQVITDNASNAKIQGMERGTQVHSGDKIVLINANGANLSQSFQGANSAKMSEIFGNTPASNTALIGITRKADISYAIDDTAQTITATIGDISANEAVIKPLAEGRLAAIQNVTRGADLLMRVMEGEKKDAGTFTPIAIIDGGINKYKSGSNVDARDYRFIIGSQYQASDNFLIGLAAEYGRSNFDTHNEFASGNVDGSGHSYNYGMSLFGKLQTTLSLDSEMYMDGAIRFGRTDTEFKSGDIVTGTGDIAHYKSKVNYWGAILGTGYVYHLNDTSSFDTSIHYLWSRLGSDGINLDGDTVNFDNSSSSRVQVKEQYNYQQSENIKFILAGIYEYEMNGDADASVSGLGIDAPSVKGSTGIMEMGIIATPIEGNKDFSLNLNFRGYAGKRDGASAAVIAKYDF